MVLGGTLESGAFHFGCHKNWAAQGFWHLGDKDQGQDRDKDRMLNILSRRRQFHDKNSFFPKFL